MKKRRRRRLLGWVRCPSCWGRFAPAEALHVAQHPELVGDDILGSNQFKRFAARHFTVEGKARDEKGAVTDTLACPKCHLRFGKPLLSTPLLFMSLIGSPASGKTYFLTSMVEGLMGTLPDLGLGFGDTDPVSNAALHEYQQTLFYNPSPEKLTELRKTQQTAEALYRRVTLGGIVTFLPIPMQYTLSILPCHPHAGRVQTGRIVVLYDNAGEDYIATKASTQGAQAIFHVAHSDFLLMLYDLTQDLRWMRAWGKNIPQDVDVRKRLPEGTPMVRQDSILRTVASGVRDQRGLGDTEQTSQPLYVVIPKFDLWADPLGIRIDDEPFVEIKGRRCLDVERITAVSDAIRTHLQEVCPEFVATAESFSKTVVYIPVSALGIEPEFTASGDGDQGFFGVRPQDIQPQWATVPVLYALSQRNSRLLPLPPEEDQEDQA